jgi:ferredoxin-NADP reductase
MYRSRQDIETTLKDLVTSSEEVARADGVVTDEEQAILDAVGEGVIAIERQLVEMLNENHEEESYAELIGQCFGYIISAARQVALADGVITADEHALLENLRIAAAKASEPPAPKAGKPRKKFIETQATIVAVIKETEDTSSLRLKLDEPFSFKAGQFIMVKANVGDQVIPRAYSISSSPTVTDYLQITVRQTPEPTVSRYLNERKEGDVLTVRGPHGQFLWEEGVSDTVFQIGAGSGITPLKAILEYIHDRGLDTPTTLLYSVSRREDAILHRRLKSLTKGAKNARLYVTLTREDGGDGWQGGVGRLTPEVIARFLPGYEQGRFMLCGAPEFVKNMREALEALGIDADQIKQERWS